MNAAPSEYRVLDYGMRWSIEAMFSDFKTRGFGITRSRIKKPDRLERLIPVLAIAMYRAVSTGAKEEHLVAQRGEKKGGQESSTIPVFPLQGRPAHHPAVSRGLCQNTQALGGVDKLKGGKGVPRTFFDPGQPFERRSRRLDRR